MAEQPKAEKMHAALVRFADVERYHHGNSGASDAIWSFLADAPEASKERLYDLLKG